MISLCEILLSLKVTEMWKTTLTSTTLFELRRSQENTISVPVYTLTVLTTIIVIIIIIFIYSDSWRFHIFLCIKFYFLSPPLLSTHFKSSIPLSLILVITSCIHEFWGIPILRLPVGHHFKLFRGSLTSSILCTWLKQNFFNPIFL